MSLARRDELVRELMDDPNCDPVRLRRTLRRFGLVNSVVSGWGGTYRALIRPALLALDRPATVLDVGCGGGDVLRRVVRAARRDGFAVTGVGIDPDPRAVDVALRARPVTGVAYRVAASDALVAEGATFDVVISNHVLHHLDPAELTAFAGDSAALAGELCVHSDIRRDAVAYGAYAVGITPVAPGSFLRTDGARSIRRSFTAPELQAALPGWSVSAARPFRVLAVRRRGAP